MAGREDPLNEELLKNINILIANQKELDLVIN